MTVALYALRCFQLGLSIADLETLSVGFVLDMITESANDNCEYKQLATQEDFDKF